MSENNKIVAIDAAENHEEHLNGAYVHKFRRPFSFEGVTYSTIEFPFESLTGRDMVKIESEMQAQGEYAVAAEISRGFQARMAARAAGIGYDVLEAMPINEFNKIANAARDFLIATGF